jgi:murein DD-endopeptidase MepM/ murein hydrolase activator NlpD
MADRVPPVGSYAPVTGKREWLASRSHGARLHAGIDLAAAPGTRVCTPEAGRVVVVELRADAPGSAWKGYGPAVVVIEGASGAYHRLTHLAADGVTVRVGDILATPGTPVGRISALAHTHWEVMTLPRRRAPFATVELSLDPLAWLVGNVVQYDATIHGGPPTPGRTALTPRAFRVGYRGSLAPAPRLRGALPVPNPTREESTNASASRAATEAPSQPTNSEAATEASLPPQRQADSRARPPRARSNNPGQGGLGWLVILAALAVLSMSGSRR